MNVKEIAVLLLVIVFAASMFLTFERPYPQIVSYKFAMGAEKAIKDGGSSEPFYEFSRYVYVVFFGPTFERGNFDALVRYLPVVFGLVCTVAIYAAVRTRLGPEFAALSGVLLACSPAFLINSLSGVYTPEMLGLGAFCVSLALFLASDVVKPAALGIALAAIAGLFLGGNMAVSEVGILLAGAMVASTVVQFVYYVKEGEYKAYAMRAFALLAVTAVFLPFAKGAPVGDVNLDLLLGHAALLPFVGLFGFVAIRDLVRNTKRYELFFLAITLGSLGIALFDPIAAAPGLVLGATFGIMTIREHLKDRWVMFTFMAIVIGAIVFLFAINFVESGVRAASLALVVGALLASALLLYENEKIRNGLVFGGVVLAVMVIIFSGVATAQREYVTIGDNWGTALKWAKTGLPDNAIVGTIGPKGFVEYLAERPSCNCDQAVAQYLLGSEDTAELKAAGVTHLIVDEAYFDELQGLATIANASRVGIETYFFIGYSQSQETQKVYATFVSLSNRQALLPVDTNGEPNGEDVFIEGVGSVSYSRIRELGKRETTFITGTSRIVVPLYGERNNLFTIYFDVPEGLELVYPTGSEDGGGVRIYKVL